MINADSLARPFMPVSSSKIVSPMFLGVFGVLLSPFDCLASAPAAKALEK